MDLNYFEYSFTKNCLGRVLSDRWCKALAAVFLLLLSLLVVGVVFAAIRWVSRALVHKHWRWRGLI